LTAGQRVEQIWQTPSHDEIPKLSRDHVAAMQASDDDSIWHIGGMHHVVLQTIGRRSGDPHLVALPTWNDPEGRRIVVASFAGAKQHPSWYLNLADRTANPTVLCQVQGGTYWSTPEILAGDERQRIWDLLVADRAWYTDYQAATERIIPLVRLAQD
jgi:deazaflavin-dependent oxidoreductase (nitroreductase family)